MPQATNGSASIAYDEQGAGDPLLLIMGFATEAKWWAFQVPAFAAGFRVITFDNRGIGASVGPMDSISLEDMACDALAVLDATGVDRAHVVGISMGGAIAQHLALQAPERVRSLTLASTWCAPNAYLPRMGAIGDQLMDAIGPEAIGRASMLWLFTPKFIINNAGLLEQMESMVDQLAIPPETFHAQQRAVLLHDTHDRLGSIQAPTLIMVGRRDVFVPPELSEQIAAAMPSAEFTMIEGGHAYNIEEAESFNATVMAFLAKH